jgi:hypothetical protein
MTLALLAASGGPVPTAVAALATQPKSGGTLPNGHLATIPGIRSATQVAPEKSVAAWRDFIREFHSGRSAPT